LEDKDDSVEKRAVLRKGPGTRKERGAKKRSGIVPKGTSGNRPPAKWTDSLRQGQVKNMDLGGGNAA